MQKKDLKELRGEIKKAYGKDIELIRAYKFKGNVYFCLVDLIEYIFGEKRDSKRRGYNTDRFLRKISNDNKIKVDLLTPFSGLQATNMININGMIELLASIKDKKVITNKEFREYKKLLKEKEEEVKGE